MPDNQQNAPDPAQTPAPTPARVLPSKTLAIRVRAQIRNGGPALVEAIVSSDCIAITWVHNHTVDDDQSGDETARQYKSSEPGTVWAEARYTDGDWRMSNKIRIEGA